MKAMSIGRLAPWLVTTGIVTQLVGLAVDGLLHGRVESVARESIVSLNPGHILLGLGMALTAGGAAAWAVSSQARRGASRLATLVPAVGLLALGLVAGGFATQAKGHETRGHDAASESAAVSAQPHNVASSQGHKATTTPNGHGGAATTQDAPTVASSGSAFTTGAVHGHEGPSAVISYDEVRTLARQLDEARAAGERYRDIRTALSDGYVQVTQDLPGIAAHFIRYDLLADGAFEPSRPEMLLYSFRDGAWRFVGLSYAIPQTAGGAEPAGFAGPLDTWHYHENLCFRGGAVVGARLSPESCAARGGSFSARTFWMNHVWLAGAAPAADLFADSNPQLLLGASWKSYTPGDPVAN